MNISNDSVFSRQSIRVPMEYFWSSAVIWAWLVAVVSALFPQLQIALFSTVAVPTYYFRLALVVLATGALASNVSRSRAIPTSIQAAWTAYLLAVILSTFFVLSWALMEPVQQMTLLFANNYLLLFVLIFYACPRVINLSSFERTFRIISPLLIGLGLAQWWLADAILPVTAPDRSFIITSWYFYGEVRAFSLFASPLDFAFFLALVSAFAIQQIGRSGYRTIWIIQLVGALIAAYATYTRLSYLFVAQAVLVSLYLRKYGRPTKTVWFFLPIALLAMSVASVEILPTLLSASDTGNLLGNDSLFMRQGHWQDALQSLGSGGWPTILLGTGVTQAASNPDFIVDNTALNFALNIGVIGALTAIGLLYTIWMKMRTDENLSNPLVLALIATWSTWMSTSAYNTTQIQYLLLAIPVLLARRSN